MKIDEMTIGAVKEILALFGGASKQTQGNPYIGQVCVIRTYSAGVHVGEVVAQNGTEVDLKNSRRIWSWKGAFTLSEVATRGIENASRVACVVPALRLTQAIEIIPCSPDAIKSIEACHE